VPKLLSLAATLAAFVVLCAAGSAAAAPVTVNLRIEGSTKTLYDGPITTDAETINTPSGGQHACDGTNDGGTTTGGTPTTAAYDAAKQLSAAFDGTYSGDYFVTQIGDDAMPASFDPSWSWWVNYSYGPTGGCGYVMQPNDQILWSFGHYSDSALKLSGTPGRAATGESFTVHVDQYTQDQNTFQTVRSDATGASVGGGSTDASGNAVVSFANAGTYTLKATRQNSVRSNGQTVCVYTPGSGDCGTDKAPTDNGNPAPVDTTPTPTPPAPAAKDTTPPAIQITSPIDGKTYSKGPRTLAGDAVDSGGITQVFLRLRATDGGNLTSASRCRWFSAKRGVFTHRTVPCSKARFFRIGSNAHWSYLLPARLRKGKYTLDVKVLDHSYNAGRTTVGFKVK
jgi:hypothetical protein